VLGDLADVQQAVGAGENLDERPELHQANDFAQISFPDLGDRGQLVNHLNRFLGGGFVAGSNVDPAVIFDVLGRLWHYNPLGAAFYSSAIGVTPEAWHDLYRGRSGVELWFEEPTSHRFQRLIPEQHIRWLLARKRRLASLWEITPQHREVIERLSRYPQFAALWAESERLQHEVGYVDRVFTTVRHADLGELFLEIQWQRLLNDPRFLVSHHRPADEATAAAFARFAVEPWLSPGEPEIQPPGWPVPAAT